MVNLSSIVPPLVYLIQYQQLSDVVILFLYLLVTLTKEFSVLIDSDDNPTEYARLKGCGNKYITIAKMCSRMLICFLGVALLAKYKTMEKHLEIVEIKQHSKKVSKLGYL